MHLVHHDYCVIEELVGGLIAGHRHQLLGGYAVIGNESDTTGRILLGMPLQNGKNLPTDFLAVVGRQSLIVGLGGALSEIGHPDMLGGFEILARESENLIGEEGGGGVGGVEGCPEVIQLEMSEAAFAHFAEKVRPQGFGGHDNNLLFGGGEQGLGGCNGCAGLS